MSLDRNITKTIEESRYLATENTWRYRTIVRTIYKSYNKMKYWLYKEDIFFELKNYEEFESYTLDNLKNDLDALVNWGNLNAMADTTKVNSIEEFKNREFRYQLSPVTIEFERMLINLEHMKIENSATLESALVERFRNLLEDYKTPKEDKKLYEWWKELNISFQNLNRNYQDYISKFYSPKNDEVMKTTEFLIFKEGFVKYLREFIRTLQLNSFAIRDIFNEINEEEFEELIGRVFTYEKKIQSLDILMDEAEYKELNLGRIQSMKDWFIPINGKTALVDQLISNTNEVIRKITRYAASIADKKNNNANRKEEYKKIAKFFNECEDIKDAHKLSAVVFGASNIIKILAKEERETESINSSIYEEVPREYIIKPRIRNYREKIIKNPIIDKKAEKEEKMKKVLERRESEQKIVKKYIENGEIDFERLPIIPSQDRNLLLRLISKGQNKKRNWNTGEINMEYKVLIVEPEKTISLHCEDGVLRMPHYKIIINQEKL